MYKKNFDEQGKMIKQLKTKQKQLLEKNLKVIEGFNNINFEKPLDIEITNSMNELKNMENKFKQSLSNYSILYKNYIDDLLRYTQDNKSKYEPKQFALLVENFNKTAKTDLINQNNDLIQQSQQIYSKIEYINREILHVSNIKNSKKEELQKQMSIFNALLKEYNSFNHNTETYKQMLTDNIMITNSSYYKYILWTSIAALTMFYTFRYVNY